MKFLKILSVFLISCALLCSCAQRGESSEKSGHDKSDSTSGGFSGEDITMDGIIWWDASDKTDPEVTIETVPFEENREVMPDSSVLTISGWNYKSELDDAAFSKAAALSGLGARFVQYGPEQVSVKIMAGDSDVDIYVVSPMHLNILIKKGLCLPIESEIIDSFNSECFDYISELCRDSVGNTVAMPIGNEISFIAYPVQATEEVGFTREDITYMEDFHSLVEKYDGSRTSYAAGAGSIYEYMVQYNSFICDFEDKRVDYDTELFRKIYGLFDGWRLDSYAQNGTFPAPKGFLNPHSVGNPNVSRTILDSQKSMFLVETTDYSTFMWVSVPDPFALDTPSFDISDWRAAHIPRISENVTKNGCAPKYAVVNPYSEHFDEAVKALEYIAENFYDSVDSILNGSPFIKKDASSYPERYMTETQLFKDVFEIAQNGFAALVPSTLGSTDDFIDYQTGRISLDEAIKIYSRQIDAYLNE